MVMLSTQSITKIVLHFLTFCQFILSRLRGILIWVFTFIQYKLKKDSTQPRHWQNFKKSNLIWLFLWVLSITINSNIFQHSLWLPPGVACTILYIQNPKTTKSMASREEAVFSYVYQHNSYGISWHIGLWIPLVICAKIRRM